MLANDDWKNDIIPEIMDGHNVADFIDPDIEEKLAELDREEEALESKGHYVDNIEPLDEESLHLRKLANRIVEKKKLMIQAHRMTKNKNRSSLPMKVKVKSKSSSEMAEKLGGLGLDTSKIQNKELSRVGRKRARSVAEDIARSASQKVKASNEGEMEGIGMSRSKSCIRDRSLLGVRNVKVCPLFMRFKLYTFVRSKKWKPLAFLNKLKEHPIWTPVVVNLIVVC